MIHMTLLAGLLLMTLAAAVSAANAAAPTSRAIAKGALLQLADLPLGWRAEPHDATDEAPCELGPVPPEAKERSPDFVRGAVTSIVSIGYAYASVTAARRAVATLGRYARCFAAFMTDPDRKDARAKSTTVGALHFVRAADQSAAFEIAAEFQSGERSVTAFVDLVALRRGRVVALLAFIDMITPFDTADEVRLARRLAAREMTR